MNLLKKLLARLYYALFPHKRKTAIDLLIENGNLRVGKNCDLQGLQITIYSCQAGVLNVTIGDDCHLMGNIVVYNPNAKISIGDRVFVGPNTNLIALEEIEIESDILISWGCTIMDNDSHSLRSADRATDVVDWKNGWAFKKWDLVPRKKIKIEKKSWIGFNCIVLKGITIQEGTVLASGSVVTKTYPPYSVLGGNPARLIKTTE